MTFVNVNPDGEENSAKILVALVKVAIVVVTENATVQLTFVFAAMDGQEMAVRYLTALGIQTVIIEVSITTKHFAF